MKSVIRCTLLAVFLGSLSALAAAGAPGAPGDEPAKRMVKFADLDLSEAAGVVALYVRIQRAAQEVCEPLISRDLHSIAISTRCAEQTIAHAVAEVNAPLLTSYYLTKSPPTAIIARR
jgi:UrcA family protein